MSNEKQNRYFIIKGGVVKEAYDKFFKKRSAQLAARAAFEDEFSASACYANAREVVGLEFKDASKVPDGWKLVRGEFDIYRPFGKRAEFKELRERMRKLPLDGCSEFHEAICGPGTHFRFMEGMTIRFMSTHKIGDASILIVPNTSNGGTWEPPDDQCVEIKTSEYYKLVEDNEAKEVA